MAHLAGLAMVAIAWPQFGHGHGFSALVFSKTRSSAVWEVCGCNFRLPLRVVSARPCVVDIRVGGTCGHLALVARCSMYGTGVSYDTGP